MKKSKKNKKSKNNKANESVASVIEDAEKFPLLFNKIQKETFEYKKIMLMYESALKEVETKINIISNEFEMLHKYNPIEHVKTRIKSPESIIEKMKRKGYPITYDNLINKINDIAGIRIVCSFIPDIYKMVKMIEDSPDLKIVEEKDYIKNPKESGYKSFHIIILVPVSFSSGIVHIKVELQIRTIEMDFWASLEHKINYKYKGNIPSSVKNELKKCAIMSDKLDRKMSALGNQLIQEEMNLTQDIKLLEEKL